LIRDTLKKYPKSLNALLSARQSLFRSLTRKEIEKYGDVEIQPRNEAATDDPATALFLRAIMIGKHKSVVEIGSFDGSRIVTLKKMQPNIDAYGLDILKNYRTPFKRLGVSFEMYTPDFFNRELERPLMTSRGTMSYYEPDQLEKMFEVLKKNGVSIAFYEPSPFFHVERPTIRYRKKNRIARYYPYDDMLEAAGYTLTADKRNTYFWARSLYGLECLRFQYATI
tara:strand:+ start:763 stop:1437 length:675 start_codon:yes stop_codon:yes gene_type:complete